MNLSHIVSVFGSNDAAEGDAAYEQARRVGSTLASLGYTIANGGYRGTMEASARGAKDAGGRTLGVICSVWKSLPSMYIDTAIKTASLHERLGKLISLGQGGGYVALPGATGTLAELALVWEMMCKKILPRRPLVMMGDFWQPVVDLMASARPACADVIHTVAAPDELTKFFPPVRNH